MISFFKVGEKHEAKVELKGENYIILTQEVYYQLSEWVKHCKGEVSGFGLVKRNEHTTGDTATTKRKWVEFRVDQVVLPAKQKNSGASTDIDAAVVAEVMTGLVQQGRDSGDMRMHWHSHASMGVFHSGTDNENYDDLDNSNWLVSLVLNKEGDVLGRVDYYQPARIAMIGVPVFVEVGVGEGVITATKVAIDALDAEEAKATKSVGFYQGGGGGYGGGARGWNDGWVYKNGQWVWEGGYAGEYDGYEGYVHPGKQETRVGSKDKKDSKKLEFIKNKIRSKMRLKKVDTDRFEGCFNSSSELCTKCKDARKCDEYMMALATEAGDLVALGEDEEVVDSNVQPTSPVVDTPTNVMDQDTVDFYRGRESNGFN